MVKTRKQADAEAAQAAHAAPVPQTPASASSKTKKKGVRWSESANDGSSEKEASETATAVSSKKATPKKANPKTPAPKKKRTPAKGLPPQASPENLNSKTLPRTKTPFDPNNPSPSESKPLKEDSTHDSPLEADPQPSTTKKARAKRTPKKSMKALENEVATHNIASPAPANVKDKAPLRTGTKGKSRAPENDTIEEKSEDKREEPPKKKHKSSLHTKSKKPSPKPHPSTKTDIAPSATETTNAAKPPPGRSNPRDSFDSNETEEVSDLPQLYSDHNARVRAAAEEEEVVKTRIGLILDLIDDEHGEQISKWGAEPSKKRGARSMTRVAGDLQPPKKRVKRSSRTKAAPTEGNIQDSPKKKTKRSSRTNAAIEGDNAGIKSQNDVPIASKPKKAPSAGTPKKPAHPRKPQPTPTPGTRKSARLSGVLPDDDEAYDPATIPIKDRFKRAKTSPIPINDIGLEKDGRFTPFNPKPPKAAKQAKASTRKTRDVKGYGDRARQRAEINRRKPLTAWEKTIIRRATERLFIGDQVGPVDERLPVRFHPNLLGSAGYSVVELGAQDLLAQTPALTNGIHPIWAARNFNFSKGLDDGHRDYDRRAYRAIAPALRLATHWIEEEDYEGFWSTLCGGGISQDEESGVVRISTRGPNGVYGNTLSEESDVAQSEASTEDRIANLMQELAQLESLEWRFNTIEVRSLGLSMTAGQVSTFHDWFERDMLYHLDPPRDSFVTLSRRLRVLFLFAVHLCRQLVQQVYHHRWIREFGDTPPTPLSEVLLETGDGTSDYLEVAWDTFMFTGFVVNMNPHRNREVESPNGLAIALGRRAAAWNGSPSPMSFAALRMHWVDDLFQDTFWSQHNGAGNFPRLPDRDPPYCAQGPFT